MKSAISRFKKEIYQITLLRWRLASQRCRRRLLHFYASLGALAGGRRINGYEDVAELHETLLRGLPQMALPYERRVDIGPALH
jgi:hypothetical protein